MVENISNLVLSLEDIEAGYYERVVLKNIKMETKKNEIVLLIGPNGAGKSTLLKVVAGILMPWKGKIKFEGKELDGYSAAKRARMGISYFFQGGEVFPDLTIVENLELAGSGLNKRKLDQKLDEIFQFFPDLKSMKGKRAGLLSGGQRHQLAIGMIFIRDPKLILLDEPSAGLSPLLVNELLKKIKLIKDRLNASVLMVEQNVKEGLKVSDRIYLMKAGEIVKESYPAEIEKEDILERVFFE